MPSMVVAMARHHRVPYVGRGGRRTFARDPLASPGRRRGGPPRRRVAARPRSRQLPAVDLPDVRRDPRRGRVHLDRRRRRRDGRPAPAVAAGDRRDRRSPHRRVRGRRRRPARRGRRVVRRDRLAGAGRDRAGRGGRRAPRRGGRAAGRPSLLDRSVRASCGAGGRGGQERPGRPRRSVDRRRGSSRRHPPSGWRCSGSSPARSRSPTCWSACPPSWRWPTRRPARSIRSVCCRPSAARGRRRGADPVLVTIALGLAFTTGVWFRVSGPAFALALLLLCTYRSSWGQLLHFGNLWSSRC